MTLQMKAGRINVSKMMIDKIKPRQYEPGFSNGHGWRRVIIIAIIWLIVLYLRGDLW